MALNVAFNLCATSGGDEDGDGVLGGPWLGPLVLVCSCLLFITVYLPCAIRGAQRESPEGGTQFQHNYTRILQGKTYVCIIFIDKL